MTTLQYAAMAWWYENGQPQQISLRAVDTDSGKAELITVENGRSTVANEWTPKAAPSEQLGSILSEIRGMTADECDRCRERNLAAARYLESYPDEVRVQELRQILGAWLEEISEHMDAMDSDAPILLCGSAADYFPLEIALRLAYNHSDTTLDDEQFLEPPAADKSRRCELIGRGQQLYRERTITERREVFSGDVELRLLKQDGEPTAIPLAKAGQKQPEDPVRFFAVPGSQVSLTVGGQDRSVTLPQEMLAETGEMVTAAAALGDSESVVFSTDAGFRYETVCEFHREGGSK